MLGGQFVHRRGCQHEDHPRIDRRTLLQVGGMSLFGAGLHDLLRLEAQAEPLTNVRGSHRRGKAKSVVFTEDGLERARRLLEEVFGERR